jgi:hypothetical protein
MGENKDISVYEDDEICVVCGKRIYDWEHIEHIIPYVNVHKECAKKLKHKNRVIVKNRRVNGKNKK